jgi:hypothetical protein
MIAYEMKDKVREYIEIAKDNGMEKQEASDRLSLWIQQQVEKVYSK